FGVVEIVVARRNVWQQVPVLPTDDLARLRLGYQALESHGTCHVRKPAPSDGTSLPRTAMRRRREGGQRVSLPDTDDEQPRTDLRHAIVGGVEDLCHAVVTRLIDLAHQPLERR